MTTRPLYRSKCLTPYCITGEPIGNVEERIALKNMFERREVKNNR